MNTLMTEDWTQTEDRRLLLPLNPRSTPQGRHSGRTTPGNMCGWASGCKEQCGGLAVGWANQTKPNQTFPFYIEPCVRTEARANSGGKVDVRKKKGRGQQFNAGEQLVNDDFQVVIGYHVKSHWIHIVLATSSVYTAATCSPKKASNRWRKYPGYK